MQDSAIDPRTWESDPENRTWDSVTERHSPDPDVESCTQNSSRTQVQLSSEHDSSVSSTARATMADGTNPHGAKRLHVGA